MFKRRTIRKIIFFLVIFFVGVVAAAFVYNKFFMKIDTAEVDRYYDLLSANRKAPEYLVLDLGVKEGDEKLQTMTNRIKKIMGLKDYRIWIGHHEDTDKPPAFIKHMGYGHMGISIYEGIVEKREEMNVLAHEMGHIYVWDLDKSVFAACDQEKLVDTSGMFLGLGILTLNGLTDEVFFIPGEAYHTRKKFFGYLSPEQFGYLFARYCVEHGVPGDNIIPFLGSTGRKYFKIGRDYLARRRDIKPFSAGKVTGAYWCPECGYMIQLSLKEKLKDIKCPKCLWTL